MPADDRTAPPEEAPVSRVAEERAPAFVVVWSADEPARAGEVALFAEPGREMILGRSDEGGARRVRFFRQRAGALEAQPGIGASRISREQLVVARADGGVNVRRKGLPGLLVNGAPCEEAVVRAGDVVEVERQMLLYCTDRPLAMAPLRHGRVETAFGAPDGDGIIGESEAAWTLRAELAYAREAPGHVLITGESGAGKELAARAIHARSRRAEKAFVAHNAATFPAGLIDAELFGNPKNYPNPGMPERPGLIGEADGGVLFLDEIGELPLELHSRLLRVLDAGGEYKRLGEAASRRSDFRLVAATNRDGSALKHDLLSRLRVRVALPSLRERREDVPLLVRALVLDSARESPVIAGRFVHERAGRTEVKVSASLMTALVRWPYTTNVREIAMLLSLAMAQSTGEALSLPKEMREAGAATEQDGSRDDALSAEQVRAALARAEGNVSRVARALGLSRPALYRLMKKHGISGG